MLVLTRSAFSQARRLLHTQARPPEPALFTPRPFSGILLSFLSFTAF